MNPKRLACLLICLALLLPVAISAKPALWVVKSAGATVYLFGTVHLLPDDTDWRFPALQQALGTSQSLYIELTDDDQANMTSLVMRYGLDAGHPLSGKLNDSENVELAHAAAAAGLPSGTAILQPMRPWFAAVTLSIAPLLKDGLDPNQGVDKLLKTQMEAAGKPVLGIETAEQQIRFLAGMTPDTELDFLRATLQDVDKDAAELKQLVDVWKAGDVESIAKLEDEDMRREQPQIYQTLLVNRNQAWTEKITDLLSKPGTVFIAVGAAHLAGPDSVQTQLQRKGFTVQRL